jgi:L-fuconolactonase
VNAPTEPTPTEPTPAGPTANDRMGELLEAHRTPVRPEWLATTTEPVLEPALPIIDAHHHLWDRPDDPYGADEFLADTGAGAGTGTGHTVIASVFVECGTHYQPDGPVELRSLGETRFARQVADAYAGHQTRIAAGIVSHVDLTLGKRVRTILDRHREAAGGRLKGVRHACAWDEDVRLNPPVYPFGPRLLSNPRFRAGFAELARADLVFDVWCFHPQLPEVADLARAFPDVRIVLDHLGTPLRIGRYQGDPGVFPTWRSAITELAGCPNVFVKIGGLGMPTFGADLGRRPHAPGSAELAELYRPWFEVTLAAFGPDRCMFESNFPVDKGSLGYVVLWNSFKRLSAKLSDDERSALFSRTAARVYDLPVLDPAGDRHGDDPPDPRPGTPFGSRPPLGRS